MRRKLTATPCVGYEVTFVCRCGHATRLATVLEPKEQPRNQLSFFHCECDRQYNGFWGNGNPPTVEVKAVKPVKADAVKAHGTP